MRWKLMDYWDETMNDDAWAIALDGWQAMADGKPNFDLLPGQGRRVRTGDEVVVPDRDATATVLGVGRALERVEAGTVLLRIADLRQLQLELTLSPDKAGACGPGTRSWCRTATPQPPCSVSAVHSSAVRPRHRSGS
nr:hypothetical protein [Mycobacterium tuberculosis]